MTRTCSTFCLSTSSFCHVFSSLSAGVSFLRLAGGPAEGVVVEALRCALMAEPQLLGAGEVRRLLTVLAEGGASTSMAS